jgi:hypothetical protein
VLEPFQAVSGAVSFDNNVHFFQQEALSRGIDPNRIRKAFRKKWEETGTGFSGSQHLFEALFRGAELNESTEDVGPSTQSTSSQVIFSVL